MSVCIRCVCIDSYARIDSHTCVCAHILVRTSKISYAIMPYTRTTYPIYMCSHSCACMHVHVHTYASACSCVLMCACMYAMYVCSCFVYVCCVCILMYACLYAFACSCMLMYARVMFSHTHRMMNTLDIPRRSTSTSHNNNVRKTFESESTCTSTRTCIHRRTHTREGCTACILHRCRHCQSMHVASSTCSPHVFHVAAV